MNENLPHHNKLRCYDKIYKGGINLKTLEYQIALFLNEYESRPDTLFFRVNEKLNGICDNVPTIIPVDNTVPVDFPTVSAFSKDGVTKINVSKSRIDFFQNPADGFVDTKIRKELQLHSTNFIRTVSEDKPITRIGVIAKFFIIESEPMNYLMKKLKDSPINNLKELRIRYNTDLIYNKLHFNNITVIENTILPKTNEKGIFIQRDINSVPLGKIIDTAGLLNIYSMGKEEFITKKIEEVIA